MLCGTVFADSFTITFKDCGQSSDSNTGLKSTTISDYVADGADYIASVAVADKIFNAQTGYGLKFGNSSSGGSITLTLATPIKPTSIVMNASQYGASEGTGLLQGEQYDMTNGGGKGKFNNYTKTYDGETEVTTIVVGAAKRGYVKSVTVNYEAAAPEPAPAGYTVDFNKSIIVPSSNTASPVFQVSIGWTRIAPSAAGDGYGPYYMRYTYSANQGVDGTGALLANAQCAPQSTNDGTIETVSDYLVTPKVSGTVTLQVKGSSSANATYPSFVKFYAINDDATTVGDEITPTFSGDINNDDYVTATLTLTEATRLAIRAQWVYMDNFTATAADVPEVKSLTVASVMNMEGKEGTQGTTTYFEQQSDGTLSVPLKVLLSNTGNVDFVAGTTENYTLTLATASYASGTKTYYDDTKAIPVSLAAGASDTIEVTFSIPYTSSWLYYFVKENVTGTTSSSSRYAGTTAYEPKFIFRAAESTSTSSLSGAQAFGLISEETTKNFEIANTGTAPLIIKSITLPTGFTSANMPEIPAEGLSIAKGATQALDITLPATTLGSYSGNLTIVYLDKNSAEQTYTLAFSGNVLPAGTWAADFSVASSSETNYPAGSVAEAGIRFGTTYISSDNYEGYLYSYTSSGYATEKNKFITPKLHANAGDKLTFDVSRDGYSSSTYNLKVYVSTDRKTWGDPVYSVTAADLTSAFQTKEISFAETGDYYVAFAIFGVRVDNIIGLTKVDVAHDLYIKSINWPDASIKSGASQQKPSLDVIPLTDEAADAYTVKYVCGETVLAEGTPVALTASANSSKTFSFAWTPVVESTTAYPGTTVVFEFTDGTKIESESHDLTVTNEPKFHFISSLPSSKWYEPSDVSAPIVFAKTNQADKKTFYVYNWGSAPLTVKSITVPAGFTATPAEQFIVPAFDENDLNVAAKAVEITFSATEAGTYSDSLVVTYLDGTGAEKTFKLAISGTKLDPTKWYANFGGESNQWPAGSVYQSNISTSNMGTYSAPDYAITSTSTTDNIFVTPKLTAAAGEKLAFDAKLYSSSWNDGKVVVYAAATREEVLNAEEGTTRDTLFIVSGKDETNPMTTDFQTFEVTVPAAGDYFFGFEISNRPYVDEIYGLKPAAVAHDWTIASSNVPTKAMQNVAATATVNILNLGLADEAADSYTATLFINGEAAATADAVAIPMSHKLSDAGTQLSFEFRYPKVGTFPVYIEVKTGDYSVKTAPVDVAFTEEIAVADAIEVGSGSTTSNSFAPIDFYNFEQARTSDILYTSAQLTAFGLKSGDKITSLAFKGTLTSAKTLANSSLKAWVAMSTGDITYGSPDKSAMTEIAIYNVGDMAFVSGSNMLTINLPEAITYDGTSDLRIYLEGGGNSEYVSLNFAYDSNYQNMKWSNNASMKGNPLLYITLAAEPATYSGIVKNAEGTAVEGATITLTSNDGEGVEYTGTTDAEGAYSINVIQTGRQYNVEVDAEGYESASAIAVSFVEGSVTKDFVIDIPLLAKYFVNTNLASTEGWTAVTSAKFFDLGTGKIGEYAVSQDMPTATADEWHPATAYAFGFEARWAPSYSSYTQESKVELPAGTYTLTYDVQNANANTKADTYNNLFKVTVGDQVFTDKRTEWMNGKSNWINHTLTFDVPEDAKATLSLGYGLLEGDAHNFGKANTPVLYVSNLYMTFVSLLDGAKMELRDEIDYAYSLMTEDRTAGLEAFNAAILTAEGLLESTDVAAIKAGIEALQAAETAFLTANLPIAEATYYIYNVAAQGYIVGANNWGTRASISMNGGIEFESVLTSLPDGQYELKSAPLYAGKHLGFDGYVDNGNAANWTIAPVKGQEGVFTLATNDGKVLFWDGGEATTTSVGAMPETTANAYWMFITPEQRLATFANASAENPVDATFLINNPDFGRATSKAAWQGDDFSIGGGDHVNNNAEKWGGNSQTFDIHQTVNVPDGKYKLTWNGFYRYNNTNDNTNDVAASAHAAGTEVINSFVYANDTIVPLTSIADETAVATYGKMPFSQADAAEAFGKGAYEQSVDVVVRGGNLTIGVKKTQHLGCDWTIWDNFRLSYYGEEPVLAGDANLNGEVTTSDAVAAVSFALEKETPSAKAFKAADVDNSGNITVADAVAIVNIALEIPEPEATARGEMSEAVNFLTMNGNALELMNTTTFVGFQMDVTLTNGAMLNGVSLAERAAGLQVAYNRIAENTYRIIAFSTSNVAIEGNEGELFSLDITGNANINITNIEFADAAARAYALGFGETTGIKGIYAGATNVESYTVGGVKNDKLRKGMNIVRTADGKVKKVFVK